MKRLLVHYVHCYFKAKTHFCSCWFSPHNKSPNWLIKLSKRFARLLDTDNTHLFSLASAHHHESRLMIFIKFKSLISPEPDLSNSSCSLGFCYLVSSSKAHQTLEMQSVTSIYPSWRLQHP